MTQAIPDVQPAEFRFEGLNVRTLMIDGEPWFVAADVCEVLALRNSRDALGRLDEDEKGVATTDTLGGRQNLSTINESGLYSLILTSRKPEAKRFKRWVTSEVLPEIRKTGSFNAQAVPWIQNLSPQARIAIEDLNSQVVALTHETERLQDACHSLAQNLSDGLTPVAFARMLNGVNINQVQPTLVKRRLLIKTDHGYRSAGAYRDKYFTERKLKTEEGRACEKVLLTKRGAKRLFQMYLKNELVMKADWDGEHTHMLFDQPAQEAVA
ncbi:BRO-N domain-containing protein [Marinobacterium lutimaris]|uniref:Prophage antirepressor n=1 Tax=Marinobacterium lutimaris TaxID=568106 RepID=A0A1H5XPD2_9GAMM|nr:Bro-N domain-containing protein [Marinobacterium lutimaris]SEG13116.1 Prophage antirepressor [Marinobacterium lutimaris]